MLAIAITSVPTTPIIAYETMAARENQMASALESFYGMRHWGDAENGLARSWVVSGHGRVLVRLAYVDVHGNHQRCRRRRSTVLRRVSPCHRRIGPLSTTPWNRVKGESYQVQQPRSSHSHSGRPHMSDPHATRNQRVPSKSHGATPQIVLRVEAIRYSAPQAQQD
jgi:hypothetical protein